MKKSLIALAVLGAIAGAAQAQNSVTIYGIVDAGITHESNVAKPGGGTGSKDGLTNGNLQNSRLGFKGVEDLGGGLKALFQLETGFTSTTGALQGDKGSTNLFRRKSVVGLSSDTAGTVLLGRQTDILDDVSQWTSVKDFGNFVGAVGHNLDRLEGTRTNNSIRYNTPDLSGFSASAIYGFGEQAGQTSSGQAFGFGGQYANGPIGLFAAYYQSKKGNTPADVSLVNSAPVFAGNTGSTELKTFTIGGSYDFGPARLYGNWSRVKQPLATSSLDPATPAASLGSAFLIGGVNNSKADIFELGVNYAVTAPLHLLASVQYDKLTFVDAGSPKGKLTQFNLGTDYLLSKRTDLYSFLSYLRAKDGTINPGVLGDSTGGTNNQTAFTVGIRHKF